MHTVYLAGQMTGLSTAEMSEWRFDIKKVIETMTDYRWKAINPTEHFTLEDDEKEGMLFDLYKVRNSDLIICDFDHPSSIGTTWELAVATECKIPILGICKNENLDKLHPWWKMNAMHISQDIDDLVDYFMNNFAEGD